MYGCLFVEYATTYLEHECMAERCVAHRTLSRTLIPS